MGMFAASAWAIPPVINYQGAMVDDNGVPADGDFSITFRMWDDSTGGTLLWSEIQGTVEINDGLFDVLLGSVNPLNRQVFDNDSVWLELQVDPNPAMTPRQRIATVAYAFHAAFADTAAVALSGGGVSYALVYTVALSGGDFTSVAAALSAIPGATGPYLIRVMPGTYNEPDLSIPINVTLQGAGRDCCFLVVDGVITMNQPFAMIAGFDIQTNDPSGIDIRSGDITIADNTIANLMGDGISITNSNQNIIIHDCKIQYCDGWGINVTAVTEPFIHDNYIRNNMSGGVRYYESAGILSSNEILQNGPYGVRMEGVVCPNISLLIENNLIASNTVGISLDFHCLDPRIIGNDIFNNFSTGIEIEEGMAQVIGNSIEKNQGSGIVVNDPGALGVTRIVGNNIYKNWSYGINCGTDAVGIVSSNIINLNTTQDINYVSGSVNTTFNNNTFDTTIPIPSAPGLYNVTSTGTAINP